MITQNITAQVHAGTIGLYRYFNHKQSKFYLKISKKNLRLKPFSVLITQIKIV